jgi:hypothetical protein
MLIQTKTRDAGQGKNQNCNQNLSYANVGWAPPANPEFRDLFILVRIVLALG